MEFTAAVDKTSKGITIFVILVYLLLIVGTTVFSSQFKEEGAVFYLILLLSLLGFATAYLLRPLRYRLGTDSLEIIKQGGKTKIPYSSIETVGVLDNNLLMGSIRTFASGGLFGYFGFFWRYKFGHFQLYGTQRKNFVLLRLKSGRKIVITPDDLNMVKEIRQRI
jgi:hypothetical protein